MTKENGMKIDIKPLKKLAMVTVPTADEWKYLYPKFIEISDTLEKAFRMRKIRPWLRSEFSKANLKSAAVKKVKREGIEDAFVNCINYLAKTCKDVTGHLPGQSESTDEPSFI